MRLHSPVFEKALKRSVKQTVRSDPELRKEYRRTKRFPRRQRQRTWLSRLIFSPFLAVFVWNTIQTTHHIDSALMIINLWTLATTLGLAQQLVHLPFRSRDIPALRLLPVTESTIFRWEWDNLLRRLYLPGLGDLLAGYGALGLALHLSPFQWIGILALIALGWGFNLALAAFCAARFPRFPFIVISGNLFLLGFVAALAHKFIGSALLQFIDHTAPVFNLLAPTGWPLLLFHLLLPNNSWLFAILALPIGLILWSVKSSLQLLQARFQYHEPVMTDAPDLVPGEDATGSVVGNGSVQMARRVIGVTAIEEGILSGDFLAQEEWKRGWPERALWRWFSAREKTLAEFAFPKGLAIIKPWKRILLHFLITLLLGLGVGLMSPMLDLWVYGIGLFIVVAQVMGQAWGTGAAFRVILNYGVGIPIYAAYPISFRELSRMFLKCSIIQMPPILFLATVTMLLFGYFNELPWERGVMMGIKASLVFFAARFFALVLNFSSNSNDTSKLRLRNLGLLVFFAVFGVFFLLLGAAAIFVQFEWASWLCSLLTLGLSYGFFRIYGWFYHANRFDLMRQPQ